MTYPFKTEDVLPFGSNLLQFRAVKAMGVLWLQLRFGSETVGKISGQLWFSRWGDNDHTAPAPCCLPHVCGESSGEEQNWPHSEREGGRGLDGQLQPSTLRRSLETKRC